MYSGDRHASLQNAEPVQTQLLGILTMQRREGFRAVQGVRLDAEEVLAPDEPLIIRAVPDRANLTLLATVTDLATGRLVGDPQVMRKDADEVHHGELPPLPIGDYRLRVEGVGDSATLADPVHGLVCVIDDRPPGDRPP